MTYCCPVPYGKIEKKEGSDLCLNQDAVFYVRNAPTGSRRAAKAVYRSKNHSGVRPARLSPVVKPRPMATVANATIFHAPCSINLLMTRIREMTESALINAGNGWIHHNLDSPKPIWYDGLHKGELS